MVDCLEDWDREPEDEPRLSIIARFCISNGSVGGRGLGTRGEGLWDCGWKS